MKKIYTLSLACLLAGAGFAQKQLSQGARIEKGVSAKWSNKYAHLNLPNHNKQTAQEKTLTAFWTNNFNTPGEWAASNTSTPPGNWVVGTNPPVGFYSAGYGIITSTSGGNFAMFDSDGLGTDPANVQNAVLTYNGSVNCSGRSTVIFRCESFYKKWTDSVFVEVSNNNSTWTRFVAHDYAQDQQSANPDQVVINISAVAANQAAVYFRFRFEGSWDYFWQVDDVSFNEVTGNDAALVAGNAIESLPYPLLPLSQVAPTYTVYSEIFNNGATTLSGVNWDADVTTYYGTATVNGTTTAPINALSSDVSVSSNSFSSAVLIPDTTPVIITYEALYSDDDATNNADTSFFVVLDSTLSINIPNSLLYRSSLDSGFYMQAFTVANQDTLTSLSSILYFRKLGSMIGQQFKMYLIDTTLSVMAITKPITVTAADTGVSGIKEHVFMFNNGIVLAPGAYYMAFIDSVTGMNKIASVTSTDEYAVPGFSWFKQVSDSAWFDWSNGLGESFYMFAHFGHDLATSTKELSNEVRVLNAYPNPASDNLFVNINSSAAITLELVDALGQVVYQNTVSGNNTTHNINVSTLSSGMYFLKASNAQGTYTQKVDVK